MSVFLERVDGKVRVHVHTNDHRPQMIFSLPAPEAVSVGRRLELLGLEEMEAQENASLDRIVDDAMKQTEGP